MTQQSISDQHYANLDGYRNSREYHICRDQLGHGTRNPDEFPSLLGQRWEIDEELYEHFMDALPPLEMDKSGFTFAEFSFGDITTRYTQDGDRYFCEFVQVPGYW